jgi:hypothetical protein
MRKSDERPEPTSLQVALRRPHYAINACLVFFMCILAAMSFNGVCTEFKSLSLICKTGAARGEFQGMRLFSCNMITQYFKLGATHDCICEIS